MRNKRRTVMLPERWDVCDETDYRHEVVGICGYRCAIRGHWEGT